MAKLSNSSLVEFFKCPVAFETRYVEGLQRATTPDYLLYGTRFHEMLATWYTASMGGGVCYLSKRPEWLSEALEAEAQSMFEAYKAAYPVEDFDVVKVECPFELMVQPVHTYVGRFDMLVRDRKSGKLMVFESKTENRNSKRNLPEAWVARTQGSLYVYAAQQLHGEEIDTVILNICTRGSMGKQIGPGFRRDKLHRSPKQIQKALDSFRYVASQVDAGIFVENTSSCVGERGYQCDYYSRCHLGEDTSLVSIEPYAYLSL